MSFFDFLEKIREKPRLVRIQILWLCLLLSMAVVFFAWIFSLKGSFAPSSQEANISEDTTKPFGEARNELPSLKEAFQDIIKAIFEPKEIKEETEGTEIQPENLEIKEETEEIKPARLPLR